jgi:hypothetical protein
VSKTKDWLKDFDSGTPKNTIVTPKCYMSYPPIQLGAGVVYGGNCATPKITDANIYVGLDSWMNFQGGGKFPWSAKEEKGGPEHEFCFRISDGYEPDDPEEFISMIDWLAEQLNLGKKVHVGCMGGHGRTGMVLAALVKVMNNEEDAITWVRKNYCKKVVETKVQVNFLHQYFGIKKVGGSHKHIQTSGMTYSNPQTYNDFGTSYLPKTNDTFIPGTKIPRTKGPRDLPESLKVLALPTSNLSIWDLTNAK